MNKIDEAFDLIRNSDPWVNEVNGIDQAKAAILDAILEQPCFQEFEICSTMNVETQQLRKGSNLSIFEIRQAITALFNGETGGDLNGNSNKHPK